MKSNKKLSLSKIQVDSFITSLNVRSAYTLKGGKANTNDTITIHTKQPTSSIIVIVTITQTLPPPKTDDTKPDDTTGDDTATANDATAGCCAPK